MPANDKILLASRRARYEESEPRKAYRKLLGESMMARLETIKRDFERILFVGEEVPLLERYFLAKGAKIEKATMLETVSPRLASWDLILSLHHLAFEESFKTSLQVFESLLVPGGLLLAAFPGGESYLELKASLLAAEDILRSGSSPRVMPLPSPEQASLALLEAGYDLPVVDLERKTLVYKDLITLLKDIRETGNANALQDRDRRPPPRRLFEKAEQIYRQHQGSEEIKATLELVYLHGWKRES